MTPVFQTVRSVLARLLVPYGKPGAPDPRGAVLYTSPSTRRVRALCPDGTDVALSGTSGGGSGDVVGPASSVDSEVALFSGTTGKLIKRASATGIAKLASGVLSAVTTWPNTALTGTAYGLARFDSGGAAETLAPGATGTILTMGASAAQWSAPSATLTGSRLADEAYGSGRDGAVVADGAASIVVDGVTVAPVAGVYTLTGRDINADTLTLSDTVVLAMGGGVPRCLTLAYASGASGNAYIRDNGANASGATAGAAPGTGGSTGRNAAAGATGRGTAGAGAAGSNAAGSIGSAGGAGGAAAGGSPAGGNGGTATRTAAYGTPYAGSGLLMLTPPSPVGAGYFGGGGGGAGGNDAGSGVSGGGGAGGGVLRVFARTLGTNADRIIIQANGGDGGNATGTDNGGGGGGGGGFASLIYDYGTAIPTVQATGGGAGTASGAGANGTAGPAGITSTRKLTV